MDDNMKMTVSEIFRKNDDKYVFVTFEDGERFAEGRLPEGTIISSHGFTDAELVLLSQYMLSEKAVIMDTARKINAMKAFLNDKN